MKHALLLLLGLLALARPAVLRAAPAPPVPATLDVAGLHLTLDEAARQLVQQRADGLMRHAPAFRARVELADACFPLIDKILQQAGVPGDFRYLALQESALQGDAESAHGAVGYWQIKRETALSLGLRVDETVDERRHLVASTRAAARYLRQNQATTQNWLLALLSYHTGLGGVRAHQQPTDAGATQLSITADTHPYLLMFLAQKLVFEPACGRNPNPPLRLREVPAVPGRTLAEQAAALAADPAALRTHNPWLRRPDWPVPTEGGPYTLLVPVLAASGAAQPGSVASQPATGAGRLPPPSTPPAPAAADASRVEINGLPALIALPNETAEDLARRGEVRLSQLLRDNELYAFDPLVPGRPYYLQRKRDEAATDYHVVQPGETVPDVSQQYGIQRRAIRQKNRLSPTEELRPGRVLWLRHLRPQDVAVEYRDPAEAAALARRPATLRPAVPPMAGPAPVAPVAPTPAPAAAPAATPPAEASAAAAPPAPAPRPTSRPAPVASSPAAPATDGATPTPEAETTAAAAPTPVQVRPVEVAPASGPAPPPVWAGTAPAAAAPVRSAPPLPADGLYQVQARESVYALARRYQLRAADLLAWNSLPPSAGLRLGQWLRLTPPPASPASPETAAVPVAHTVVAGETLYSIARRYGRTPAELQQLNGLLSNRVRVGEVLRLVVP